MVHKALNPIQPALMGPAASESSSLSGRADPSDASDEMTFVRDLSRTAVGPFDNANVDSLGFDDGARR
jgi:hypothetical protein